MRFQPSSLQLQGACPVVYLNRVYCMGEPFVKPFVYMQHCPFPKPFEVEKSKP